LEAISNNPKDYIISKPILIKDKIQLQNSFKPNEIKE